MKDSLFKYRRAYNHFLILIKAYKTAFRESLHAFKIRHTLYSYGST
jgi:hypothetical protein